MKKNKMPSWAKAQVGKLVEKTSEEKAHATFSASGSERWLACPGSIPLSSHAKTQGLAPSVSPYAQEGTDAHACLEFLLRNRKKQMAAAAIASKKWPTQMVVHAETTLREVERRLSLLPDSELHIEVKADLPVSEPGQFGTADIVIVQPYGVLEVMDYKYGAGIQIDPEENSQLIYYALGVAALHDYEFTKVRLSIIQPRIPVDGETFRTWETTIENLIEWRDKFEVGIQAAKEASRLGPEKYLVAGKKHCRFCPAAALCPEIGNAALREAAIDFSDDFSDVKLPSITGTFLKPIRNLPKILKACDSIETWIEAVRSQAFGLASRGEKIPGFKLVEKRGTRKWNDYDAAHLAADEAFGASAFAPVELLTPAQFEEKVTASKPKKFKGDWKATVKQFVAENATVVSSGLKLVSETERGEAIDPLARDFEEEDWIDP